MDIDEASVRTMEGLLDQFFDFNTDSKEKLKIEMTLESFREHPAAWKHCIFILNKSSNHYVHMYCLGTLEAVITRKWLTLMTEDKSHITLQLYDYCLERHDKVAPFTRNKLLKLIADIARYDWPHFYPNFLSNILMLIQSNDEKNIILGLLLLHTTSEELICPREDISGARKEELKTLLLNHIPQVFTILVGLFERLEGTYTSNKDEILLAALCAICHIFSWVPLQYNNCPSLINIICELSTKMETKGDHALTTLNEILYKSCVPHSFLSSLLTISCHGNLLVKAVILNRDIDISENSTYLRKLTELIRLMISGHWSRLEAAGDVFPIFDFLSNFYQYTFHVMTADSMFYECLESWHSFVDHVTARRRQHNVSRYHDVLLMLVQEILKKMETGNGLDDENVIEYEVYDTEYDKFLNQCMELIEKIANIIPDKTCSVVLEIWQPSYAAYYQLLNSNSDLPDELPVSLLNTVLSLTGTTRALGAISDSFSVDEKPMVLSSVAAIAAQATRANIHTKHQTRPIQQQLVNLHIQFLDALKSWFNCERSETGLDDAFQACIPLLLEADNQSPALQKAAASLLSSVTGQPRPARLLPLLEPLFISSLHHLAPKTRKIVQLALIRCILFWNWDVSTDKLELLRHVVKQMTPGGLTDLKEIIWLLKHCHTESKERRKMFFSAIQPLLEDSVNEFPQLVENCPEICENVLSLYLHAFETFQDLLDGDFIYKSITVFLAAFQNINLKENTYGIEELLELLTLIIQHPAKMYRQFLPHCIELSLDQIYPHVADIPSPHIKPALFQLFKSILLCKWQYFYTGSLLGDTSVLEHKDRFCQILLAFGQSFTQTDIRVFSQNLHALEAINEKWKLYHKDLFRSTFLGEFLTVLMNNLVEKTHALLGDEIAKALYNMAAVDFNTYFNSFIPHFLSITSGLDTYQREALHSKMKPDTDLPSFTENMQRLANDIRCYRLCNGN